MLIGIVCIFVGTAQSGPVAQVAVTNLGVTILTIGSVGVIYDSLLRSQFVEDLLGTKELAAARIKRVAGADALTIAGPLRGRISIVVPSLGEWLKHTDWDTIVREASSNKCFVAIYTGQMSSAELFAAQGEIESDWTRRVSGRAPADKSGVAIYSGTRAAAFYLCVTAERAWLGFGDPMGDYRPGKAVGMSFEESSSRLWQWAVGAEAHFRNSCTRVAAYGNDAALRKLETDRPVADEDKGILR
jgi:hypothetical protein